MIAKIHVLDLNTSLIWTFISNIVPTLDCVFWQSCDGSCCPEQKKTYICGSPCLFCAKPHSTPYVHSVNTGLRLPIFQHVPRLLCIFCSLVHCCNFDVWQVFKALIYSKPYCSQSDFGDFKRTSELKSPRPILHAAPCHYKQSTSDCASGLTP